MRYQLGRFVARLLWCQGWPESMQRRVCFCCRRRLGAGKVEIRLDCDSRRAHFRGLEHCSDTWVCPICNQRITEHRRGEIQTAAATWIAQGGEVYLMTLTAPHERIDRLADLLEGMRRAACVFKRSRLYRQVSREAGRVGNIRALEVTWSFWHGWHVHFHELIFARRGALDILQRFEAAWIDAVIKSGLATPAKLSHLLIAAFQVQNGDYAAEYVAKYGHEPVLASRATTGETWGVAREMVKGAQKIARFKGKTPFALLLDAFRGDRQAAMLFREFAECFRGERQLYFSPRLRRVFNMGKLFTDEELPAVLDAKPTVQTVATLTGEDWRCVIEHDARNNVLESAERYGADGVMSLLENLYRAPPTHQGYYTEAIRRWWL